MLDMRGTFMFEKRCQENKDFSWEFLKESNTVIKPLLHHQIFPINHISGNVLKIKDKSKIVLPRILKKERKIESQAAIK